MAGRVGRVLRMDSARIRAKLTLGDAGVSEAEAAGTRRVRCGRATPYIHDPWLGGAQMSILAIKVLSGQPIDSAGRDRSGRMAHAISTACI